MAIEKDDNEERKISMESIAITHVQRAEELRKLLLERNKPSELAQRLKKLKENSTRTMNEDVQETIKKIGAKGAETLETARSSLVEACTCSLPLKTIVIMLCAVVGVAMLIAAISGPPNWYSLQSTHTINNQKTSFLFYGNLANFCFSGGLYKGQAYSPGCWNFRVEPVNLNPNSDPAINILFNETSVSDGIIKLQLGAQATLGLVATGIALDIVFIGTFLFTLWTTDFLMGHFALLTTKLMAFLVWLFAFVAFWAYYGALVSAAAEFTVDVSSTQSIVCQFFFFFFFAIIFSYPLLFYIFLFL
jgi:hypothetical protein